MSVSNKIKQELKRNDVVIYVISTTNYGDCIKDLIGVVTKMNDKICYTTLNKPYSTMISILEKAGIDTTKIIFIDSASGGFKNPDNKPNVIFISSPKALTDMNIQINKVIDNEKINDLVFDSLSTLMAYEEESTIIKFTHSIISKIRTKGIKVVFTCLKDDMKGELMKDLSMFVDKIIEVK